MDTNETSIGWITLKAGMKIQGKVLDLVMTVDLTMASTATIPIPTRLQRQPTVKCRRLFWPWIVTLL